MAGFQGPPSTFKPNFSLNRNLSGRGGFGGPPQNFNSPGERFQPFSGNSGFGHTPNFNQGVERFGNSPGKYQEKGQSGFNPNFAAGGSGNSGFKPNFGGRSQGELGNNANFQRNPEGNHFKYQGRQDFNERAQGNRMDFQRKPQIQEFEQEFKPNFQGKPQKREVEQGNMMDFERKSFYNEAGQGYKPNFQRKTQVDAAEQGNKANFQRKSQMDEAGQGNKPNFQRKSQYDEAGQGKKLNFQRKFQIDEPGIQPNFQRKPPRLDSEQGNNLNFQKKLQNPDSSANYSPNFQKKPQTTDFEQDSPSNLQADDQFPNANHKKILKKAAEPLQTRIPETKILQKFRTKSDSPEVSTFTEDEELRSKALASFHRLSHKKSPIPTPTSSAKPIPKGRIQIPARPAMIPQSKPENFIKKPEKAQNTTMCSQEETRLRQESHQLSIFEITPGTEYEGKANWTIKKYLRSSADREEDKRSSEDLSGTLSYLLSSIIDVDTDGNPNNYKYAADCDLHEFKHIYPFVFDRMRAITKDWKMLNDNESDLFLTDHEYIARFLILSCVEGYYYEDFNQNLNLKLIEDVLNCLIKAYKNRGEKKIPNENEAEFTAYYIVTKPDNMLHITTLLKSISGEILKSAPVQLALKVFQAFHSENYCEFFNAVKNAPFLLTCASYPLFHKVRIGTILKFFETSTRVFTVSDFSEMFWFSSFEETKAYLAEIDLKVSEDKVFIRNATEKANFVWAWPQQNVLDKKNERSREEIVKEPEALSEIQESFEVLAEVTSFQEVFESPPALVKKKSSEVEKKPIIHEQEWGFMFNVLIKHVLEDIVLQAAEEKAREPVKVLEIEKKSAFRFPIDDKSILSIVKDPKEKEKFIQNIRNYRSQKKINRKEKEKKIVLIRQNAIFKQWKRYFRSKKLKKYVILRKEAESKAYISQFSNQAISDNFCHMRLLRSKRQRLENSYPPDFSPSTLSEISTSKKIPVYKILISSPESHNLYKFALKSLLPHKKILEKSSIFLNFGNECHFGCDLIIFIGKFSDLYKVKATYSQRLVCIIEDPDITEEKVLSKLDFPVSHLAKIICLPLSFEANEYSFYDLIEYQLYKSLQHHKVLYKSLSMVTYSSIIEKYENYFENIEVNLKMRLFSNDFKDINSWVDCINSLTFEIISGMRQFYSSPPSEELFFRHGVNPDDYELLKQNYLEVQGLMQKMIFKQLPKFCIEDVRSKDIMTVLYRYAASMIRFFEEYFQGCAYDLLKALDELFCNSPVVVNHKLNYIKGPWSEYFLTILSIITDYIETLQFKIVWDCENKFESDQSPSETYKVDLDEIKRLGVQYFNDEISEIIFIRELNLSC